MKQIINDNEYGLETRTKLNDNFTELYDSFGGVEVAVHNAIEANQKANNALSISQANQVSLDMANNTISTLVNDVISLSSQLQALSIEVQDLKTIVDNYLTGGN